jgi:hypothetical protein
MPKTGARRLMVDGVAYRWRVRHRAHPFTALNWDGRIHVSVELADAPGSVLVVFTGHQHSRDIENYPPGVDPVLPSHVAEWVQQSLAAGWRPSERGPQFHVCPRAGRVEQRLA